MTAVTTLQKRVEKLQQKLAPKTCDQVWIVMWSPPDGNPDVNVEVIPLHPENGKSFTCRYGDLNSELK